MSVIRLQRADDARVAPFRHIRDGELMRSAALFVAEGRHIVRRIVEDGRHRIQSLMLNDAALHDLEPVLAMLDGVPVFVGDAAILSAIAGYDVHRGCLALVHRPPPTPADALAAAATRLIVLEGVANADNVGGIFRNAAAFAADGVLLGPNCCDPLYRKAIRTSMGATLRVPYASAHNADWPNALMRLKAAGFVTIALTLRAPSEPLRDLVLAPAPVRIALILGNEGHGLTAAAESAADHRVRIPIAEGVDSLNVAVAAAIALYELRTRASHQLLPAAAPPPMSAGRKTASRRRR
jgi:tRNA G18 (ribose-2'-O)-methylase SpoU